MRIISSLTGWSTGTLLGLAILIGGSGAVASPLDPPDPLSHSSLAEATRNESIGATPIPAPSTERFRAIGSSCVPLAEEGTHGCISPSSSGARLETRADVERYAGTAAVQPVPDWCIENFNQGRFVTRTQDCESFGFSVTKTRTTNGVTTVVGTAHQAAISYQYTSFSIARVAHQFEFSTSSASGDLTGLTLGALSNCGGSCVAVTPGVIDPQPLTPGIWHEAESFTEPASTALGSIHHLDTSWTISLYGGGATQSLQGAAFDLRCDNASGGSAPVAGCAVYYAPGQVIYNSFNNPALVNHISQAHASGLAGGSVYDPIHRTTVASVIAANRAAACGGVPSIQGLSCDEYPFASSYEGAASGGTVRSFPGCVFLDPAGSGPDGFSRCMIPASENSSGGAILGNTYRQQRILDSDPYFVTLS